MSGTTETKRARNRSNHIAWAIDGSRNLFRQTGEFRQRQLYAWAKFGYLPGPEQLEIHNATHQLRQVAGGVGAGKSYSSAMDVLPFLLFPNTRTWLIAADYERARPEFEYIRDALLALDFTTPEQVLFPRRGAAQITAINGSMLQTKSGTDVEAIAGWRPDCILCCEAAMLPSEILFKVFERASEKDAPILLSGTFEGSLGFYADLWRELQAPGNKHGGKSFSLPSWSNKTIYPGGRNDPKILKQEQRMPAELFAERFGGIPHKPSGLVFDFDFAKHTAPVEELYDPSLPVELAVDPATHAYPVLFVQRQRSGAVHILDELYMRNVIGQEVIPHVVVSRFWPIADGVMDIAGAKRAGANKPQIEVWNTVLRELGETPIRWSYVHIDLEEQWRYAISLRLNPPGREEPLLKFASHLTTEINYDGTARGILGELRTYQWGPPVLGGSERRRPRKFNEDALSGLGYFLVVHYGNVIDRKFKSRKQRRKRLF